MHRVHVHKAGLDTVLGSSGCTRTIVFQTYTALVTTCLAFARQCSVVREKEGKLLVLVLEESTGTIRRRISKG